jgi:hypothetical protein
MNACRTLKTGPAIAGITVGDWASGGQAGRTMMKRTLLTRDLREPDLNITRAIARPRGGRFRHLIGSIFRNSQAYYQIVTPRRSVDREYQLYSRVTPRPLGRRLHHLIDSIFHKSQAHYQIVTPCRSLDHEYQLYSPDHD